MLPRSTFGWILVAWLGLVAGGCYYHRVEVASSDRVSERPGVPPTGKTGSATAWSFLFGTAHSGGITPDALAQYCNNLPLREVTVKSNPLFFLITAVTLGLVAPAQVEWHCTRPMPVEGEMPDPPDDQAADTTSPDPVPHFDTTSTR